MEKRLKNLPLSGKIRPIFSIEWKTGPKSFHRVENCADFFPLNGKFAPKVSIEWKTPSFSFPLSGTAA